MDGPSAWAEIDSILASIDPNRASWISQLESAATVAAAAAGGDYLLVGLDDWAALNRLEEDVLAALLTNGFDCAGFVNGVLSDADLQELGMRSATQRRRVLTAVQDLPSSLPEVAESISGSSSLDWLLQRLCLTRQLGKEFAAAAVIFDAATVDDLASVTDSELRLRFGVHKLGHRRRIACCLDRLRALRRLRRPRLEPAPAPLLQQPTSSSSSTALTGVYNGVQHARQNSNLSTQSASSATAAAARASSTSSDSASHMDEDHSSLVAAASAGIANRRNVVRPTVLGAAPTQAAGTNLKTQTEVLPRRELPGISRSWVATTGGRRSQDVGAEDATDAGAKIPQRSDSSAVLPRSLSTDCLDDAGKKRLAFQPLISESWPHHPDVLLRDSFSYSVSYLGFRPLAEHTDPAETAQVMLMFRCKSADILKLPRIRLTVCYRGVKFINPDNDMVITEHRITEIYFACQDSSRRANFAYVTKDSVNSVHYCHCFASHSPETAVLIIQTLSEACGLANQLIEFNQLRRRQLTAGARRRSSRKQNRRP